MTPKEPSYPASIPKPPEHQLQTQPRPTEGPTDINQIPGVCPRPVHFRTARCIANHGDADSHFALLGGISTDQCHSKLPCRAAQSRQESIEPSPGALARQSQAEQEIARPCTHRG